MNMSSHQTRNKRTTDEWLTPPEILRPLGTFDLDPCSPIIRPWPTANNHYTIKENGLDLPWKGRVWLNPPFVESKLWLEKMVEHGNGIVLLAARTETKMFFDYVWKYASGILFLKGRPHFFFANGKRAPFNSGVPICLVSYDNYEIGTNANATSLMLSNLGKFLDIF